ncbi:MAG: family 43 glycosylhydrolase [Planctomycetes bacterium]|nr:family 43 glycosylhydrolase [Planctomycetota bacterium]
MMFGDASRLGRPFAKDPAVIRFGGRYLLYYSIPPAADRTKGAGWAAGIAESRDLDRWTKVGEILPEQECDRKGLAAPEAIVLDRRVHLFYQTYGNGPKDAICHAVSDDGLRFIRDPTNPIFRPSGAWTCGRAIDAEVFEHEGRLFLLFATRDPAMAVQKLGAAAADRKSDFGRASWIQLRDGPILEPELPWERSCIEAASVCRHDGRLYLFYAGGYNNEPQQIGCAVGRDGIRWTRLSDRPLLPNGGPGEWNVSESGHPGVFIDGDGRGHLFFQGNADRGRTWFISRMDLKFDGPLPFLVRPSDGRTFRPVDPRLPGDGR